MKAQFMEEQMHSFSIPERIQWLHAQFKSPEINGTKEPISIYNFRWSYILFLLAAIGSALLGFWKPGTVWIGILIAVMAIREFYHPFVSRFKGSPAENLYYTIPARSKEVQKLYLISTYATDNVLEKPQSLNIRQILIIHHLAFISFGLISVVASFSGIKVLWFAALIPLLVFFGWSLTFSVGKDRDAFFNCTVLADLKNLLTKARPVSTSVTFAFLGSRSLHSGAYHLLPLLKDTSKITYVVNLTDHSSGNDPFIISKEGSLFPQESDSTLVELLQIVATEKGIAIDQTKTADYTEIFPFLTKNIKAVSIAIPQANSSEHHRNLRELLAGLIRKIEH
ncbi:MAG TPA: hypothetical protein PLC07_01955 [Bacillota bacterium]|nr:hypothetical protein [Bacillota bacterium]HPT87679.1 hypothetical protein [Bacillota bacterium]